MAIRGHRRPEKINCFREVATNEVEILITVQVRAQTQRYANYCLHYVSSVDYPRRILGLHPCVSDFKSLEQSGDKVPIPNCERCRRSN